MTMDEIKTEVQHISDMQDDDESAHSMEDALRDAFIVHVAENAGGELAEMAREVLKTGDIVFCRWYA